MYPQAEVEHLLFLLSLLFPFSRTFLSLFLGVFFLIVFLMNFLLPHFCGLRLLSSPAAFSQVRKVFKMILLPFACFSKFELGEQQRRPWSLRGHLCRLASCCWFEAATTRISLIASSPSCFLLPPLRRFFSCYRFSPLCL